MRHLRALSTMVIVVLAGGLATFGCRSADVYRCGWNTAANADPGQRTSDHRLPGIPFFAKKGVYVQTTVYELRWLQVELKIMEHQGASWEKAWSCSKTTGIGKNQELDKLREGVLEANGILTLEDLENGSTEIKDAVSSVTTAPSNKTDLKDDAKTVLNALSSGLDMRRKAVIAAFNNLNEAPCATTAPSGVVGSGCQCCFPEVPISNSLQLTSVVDYDHPLCLNTKTPLFGKADFSHEFASDGTITKAASSVDMSDSAGQIASLLPLKEFLVAELIPTDAKGIAAMAAAPAPAALRFELTIKEAGFTYEFQKEYGNNPGDVAPIMPSMISGTFTRAPIKEDEMKPKKSGETVTVSGEIVLPKRK